MLRNLPMKKEEGLWNKIKSFFDRIFNKEKQDNMIVKKFVTFYVT